MLSEKLYAYQVPCVDFIVERAGSAVFLEQGTGKTYVLAGALERLMTKAFRCVIVVPLANIETTWVRTLQRELPDLRIARTWQEYKQLNKEPGALCLLLHYEGVAKVIKYISKRSWDLVAYDESQRLKARGSRQSRHAKRFKNVRHRVILSGTPIEQAPQDLWAQFRFALPGVLEDRWADFAERWCRPTGFMGYKLKFRMELLPKFLKLIRPHIIRLKKEDVLTELPPLKYVRCPVELLGNQRRVYRDLEGAMVTTVNGEDVTADMAIVQTIRLQQVCGGFVRLDPTPEEIAATPDDQKPKGRIVKVGEAKLRRLKTILARERPPLVIFCKYKYELKHIVRACSGMRVGIIAGVRGRAKRRERVATVEAFQRGELDVLVCQVRAGGVGLDLQNACVGIFYSTTFSFIDFDQAVSRLHRNGQTRPVRIYIIFAKDTVDEDIISAVRSKLKVSEAVLSRMRRRRTHRGV